MNALVTGLSSTLFPIVFAFVTSYGLIRLGKPVAVRIGLVDLPGGRKEHNGAIPLIGGIAIFLSVLTSSLLFFPASDTLRMYLLSAILMLFIGVLDDKYDLKVSYRLFAQAFAASLMIFGAGEYLKDFGNLFGFGVIELGWFGPIITLIAVIGAINAFNMVDGIDGLAGMLSIISFSSIAFLMAMNNNPWFMLPLLYIAAIGAYLMFNLGWPKGKLRKIFMGDAGSMVIGLTIVWLLILGSQGESRAFSPVIALWVIAIPLMDMAAIMYRRKKKGQSPFKPDRDHLHHICMRAGLKPRGALAWISGMSTIIASVGIASYVYKIPDIFLLIGFLALFFGYCYAIQRVWKLVTWLRSSSNV
ncbi:UDP-N-acetylglucosamine--undecaprenyl-phosphate N-acetylglucosaminephosphotransferase [Ferrimonas balearica]|uniref:UDP-N-acetylglucosamine--undecaprenyl-phosphate N-acetylglucosaminephosphotransferase n=1 Tax=Ferrimonas balearica TaxID=44012 RepID=UPI002D7FE941|nr:UDP-N-acetylglucosamine--undecaprenyl-phosphate N-acetylglucosaminephosphotransferase [Ferrimonas balearica]MBY6018275.1 UDP-N-acetylglucosamine--undecaprenyl-phosphate N-acetylglucosaminephosphotransferase [Halomonas denitrificans]MBY6094615.1 UDP-N-acetylglucosamine--undecaprenyl-phosphate N-acetylglucosaminephosphotransferase [Ferrimonas balearica]